MFLVSSHSLKHFWGCLVWHLWLERPRHPGPGSGSVGIEVFNVGGWLTNGDFGAETSGDFLCVAEHRLVSAGLEVSGGGCGIKVFLPFGPPLLRSYL